MHWGKPGIFSSVLQKSLSPGLRSFLLPRALSSRRCSWSKRSRQSLSRALACPCAVEVCQWFYNRQYKFPVATGGGETEPSQALALAPHSSCGSASPGTPREKVNTFQGLVFPQDWLCAWVGTTYAPLTPTPACPLLQLTSSRSTTSL